MAIRILLSRYPGAYVVIHPEKIRGARRAAWRVVMIFLIASSITLGKTARAEDCLASLHITRNDVPWNVQAGPLELVRAVKMDAAAKPIPRLQKYAPGGGTLMSLDQRGLPVVDLQYFSDLKVVRATYIQPDTKLLIGSFKDLTFQSMTPRRLALFLIDSQLIQTYLHIESNLCLVAEHDDSLEYRASFRGTHIYYTNERNEKPIAFDFLISKKSGAMHVAGASTSR